VARGSQRSIFFAVSLAARGNCVVYYDYYCCCCCEDIDVVVVAVGVKMCKNDTSLDLKN